MNKEEFEKQFKVKYAATESWFDRALTWLVTTGVTAAIAIAVLALAAYGAVCLLW